VLIFSEFGQTSSRLKASMGRFLLDEAAIKAMFSGKRASGLKPCRFAVIMKGHPAILHDCRHYNL
jgi:hypothetical protein